MESRQYSLQDKAIVEKILNTEDYYEMLEVDRRANDAEINRTYKEIAKLVHPDKNGHPKATKAFQLIRKAVDVLTDQQSRETYDFLCRLRDEVKFRQNSQNTARQARQNTTRQERRTEETIKTQINWRFVILFLGVILALSVLYFWQDAPYSFQMTGTHRVYRKTASGVEYYVTGDFFGVYNKDSLRKKLEKSIEDEYSTYIHKKCQEEINNRDWILTEARFFGDRKLFQSAHYSKMPLCDKLQTYISRLGL